MGSLLWRTRLPFFGLEELWPHELILLSARAGSAAQAFLAASMKADEELEQWFRDRLVWTDPAVVTDLLKSGLFVRAYEPQVHLTAWQSLLTAWQSLLAAWQRFRSPRSLLPASAEGR